jgi:hypothetical protein
MRNRKLEKEIEDKFVRYAWSKNCKCIKFKDPGRIGGPDRMVHLPGGYCFYIEFKREDEEPKIHQKIYRDELLERDIESFVLDSFEEAKEILDERLQFQVLRTASVIWKRFKLVHPISTKKGE